MILPGPALERDYIVQEPLLGEVCSQLAERVHCICLLEQARVSCEQLFEVSIVLAIAEAAILIIDIAHELGVDKIPEVLQVQLVQLEGVHEEEERR